MCKNRLAVSRYSFVFVALLWCMRCQAECRHDTRELQADDLEGYGIHVWINPASDTEIHRVNLQLQSEICIKTDETSCGLAIYTVSEAILKSGSVNESINLHRPNSYELTTSFNLSNAQIANSVVELVYRGAKCDTQNRRRQSFIISLDEIPVTGS